MYAFFTTAAREVVVVATDEARIAGHACVAAEHLLLGLLGAQGGIAAGVLESFAVTADGVRSQVSALHVDDAHHESAAGISFSPSAKRVLELALQEARTLQQRRIATEHILLALLRRPDADAARVLAGFDAPPEQIFDELLRRIREEPAVPAMEVLRPYLPDVLRDMPLTAEEEVALARRIEAGDESARRELVRANLRLVVRIARNHRERGLSLIELVGEGMLGLVEAAETYDVGEGARFANHATRCISRTIARALVEQAERDAARAPKDPPADAISPEGELTPQQQALVAANLPLVAAVAGDYGMRGLTFLGLVHEGTRGLARAAQVFDARAQVEFEGYARVWIARSIERALREQGQ